MSTEHDCTVTRLGPITKHDNADTLGITEVDGRPCIVRLGEWQPGDLAIYIPVDAMVPTNNPRFAFLNDKAKMVDDTPRYRVRAMKLRGVFSMGLLIKPEHGMVYGDVVNDTLNIITYEPDSSRNGGHGPGGKFLSAAAEPDPGFLPVYDVESARKYRNVLLDGEEVVITEKIHGANARFAFHDGRLWCASRNQFKRMDPTDLWWSLAIKYDLEAKLANFPGVAIYGEAYGQVQDLKYRLDEHRLVLFDALDIQRRRWLDFPLFDVLAAQLDIPTAPVLYKGPWRADDWPAYKMLAEGPSVLGNDVCVREGWVLRPVIERQDHRLGRVQMKLHGEGFLTRKGG